MSRCQDTKADRPSSPGSRLGWTTGKSDSSRWETRCCSPKLSGNCIWEQDTYISAWPWRAEGSGIFSFPPLQRGNMASRLLPFLVVDKELRRCDKASLERLRKSGNDDVFFEFPNCTQRDTRTGLVLKTPKTESSVRKIYLPITVIAALKEEK